MSQNTNCQNNVAGQWYSKPGGTAHLHNVFCRPAVLMEDVEPVIKFYETLAKCFWSRVLLECICSFSSLSSFVTFDSFEVVHQIHVGIFFQSHENTTWFSCLSHTRMEETSQRLNSLGEAKEPWSLGPTFLHSPWTIKCGAPPTRLLLLCLFSDSLLLFLLLLLLLQSGRAGWLEGTTAAAATGATSAAEWREAASTLPASPAESHTCGLVRGGAEGNVLQGRRGLQRRRRRRAWVRAAYWKPADRIGAAEVFCHRGGRNGCVKRLKRRWSEKKGAWNRCVLKTGGRRWEETSALPRSQAEDSREKMWEPSRWCGNLKKKNPSEEEDLGVQPPPPLSR